MAGDRFEQGSAETRAGAAAGPETAAVLARWRKRAGVSRQRLADLSDVSATYVRTIEAGVDDQDREVVPSAAIMQKLAGGLAQVLEPDSEADRGALTQQIYAELMAAAGYLPAGPAPQASGAPPGAGRDSSAGASAMHTADGLAPSGHRVSEDGQERGAGRDHRRYGGPAQMLARDDTYPGGKITVTLRDPRLREHLQPLLQRWETLSSDDQALLLGIMAWVHERHQRAHHDTTGGM